MQSRFNRRGGVRAGTTVESERHAESERAAGLTGGSSWLRWDRPWRLDGVLREVALHGGLAREVDPTLAVDLGDDDHDLVADGHDVLDGRHVVVSELADADEAFLARQDLDEGAEAHDPGDLAEVERADLDLAGQALDPLDRLAGVLAGHRGDLDRPVVLDVDLGLGLLLDLADHGAALADDLADLLGVDLDRDDARCEVAHDLASLGQDLGHLVEDLEARREGLLEAVADDRLVDALDLDVHLQGGDAVPRAGHLEVHVTDRVLLAEDVGQDDEAAVRLADQAHRRAGDRCRDRHAGVHDRERRAAGRRHRRRAVGRHALGHEPDDVRELLVARQDRDERSLGQVAVTDVATARATHRLVLAGAVRGEVVVVDVALLGLGADRVDALDVRGRAERRDRHDLGLTAGEQARAVRSGQDADLDRDLAQLRQPAAVHPDALVEGHLAGDLLVDEIEQALADPRLALGSLLEELAVAAAPRGADGVSDAGLEGCDALRQVVPEPDEQVRGRL